MEIKLAGKAYPLVIPTGMIALDVRVSFPGFDPDMRGRLVRWNFGVVGLAWAGKRLGWPELAACKHDVLALGEHVHAGLAAEGLLKTDADLQAVADAAMEILVALVPNQAQVDEARDFSPPPSGKI